MMKEPLGPYQRIILQGLGFMNRMEIHMGKPKLFRVQGYYLQ